MAICRVPEREFSQAPKDSLLVYLCRFTVRSPWFWLEVFLGSAELAGLRPLRDSPSRLSVTATRIYLRDLPTRLDRDIHHPDRLSLCVTPLLITNVWWYRNVNLFPIDYAFRPRLRGRLTLGGMTFPRKPSAYGEGDSHSLYRYSSRHNHLNFVQESLPSPFSRWFNASLPRLAFTASLPELRFES